MIPQKTKRVKKGRNFCSKKCKNKIHNHEIESMFIYNNDTKEETDTEENIIYKTEVKKSKKERELEKRRKKSVSKIKQLSGEDGIDLQYNFNKTRGFSTLNVKSGSSFNEFLSPMKNSNSTNDLQSKEDDTVTKLNALNELIKLSPNR